MEEIPDPATIAEPEVVEDPVELADELAKAARPKGVPDWVLVTLFLTAIVLGLTLAFA